MANVTITQLPAAGAITGTEAVPIVQNGVTVQTTTAALAGSPVQTQTFLTLNQEPTLNNSRALSNGTGVGLVDGGAQSTLSITLNAASGSLEAASNGMIAKTASNAVAARTMSSTTTGLSVTDGDGVAGNPTFALTGVALAVAGATGTGALALTSSTTVSTRQILGTTSQIDIADGDFANSPVIAISADPVLNGNGGLVIPVGTTGQRGTSTNGNIRFNTTTGLFEGYNGAWTAFAAGTGVTSVGTGTGLSGGPITSIGTISLADTAVVPGAYTRASITVDQQGRLTSAASGPAINLASDVTGTLPIANGGTGATTSAGAAFALKGANTDLTSVALTTGTVSTTPSAAFDLANKSYVDTAIAGLNFHVSAQYATAAALAANTYNNGTAGVGATLTGNAVGALTVDSNVVVVAQRILVKNEVAGANNGVYVVTTVGNGSTAYVLTRATDFNTSGSGSNQVGPGDYVYVTSGTANANTAWVQQTQLPIVIGTTALVFTQFGVTGAGGTNTQVQFNASGAFAGSANLTFNGTTLAAAAITASTTLGVTGLSTLSGGVTETVTNAVPASSGTARSDFQRIVDVAGSRTADYGISNSGAWIQSRDKNDYSINYPLLLNPNGGLVAVGVALSQGAGVTGGSMTNVVGGGAAAIYNLSVTQSATNFALAYGATYAVLNGTTYSGLTVNGSSIANATSTGLAVTGGLTATDTVSVGKSGAVDIGYTFGVNSVSAAAVGFNNSGSTNAYGAATSTTYFGMAQGFPIVFTTSAAERMRIGSTGAVSIPGTLAVAGGISGGTF